jgi:hypothetical protein
MPISDSLVREEERVKNFLLDKSRLAALIGEIAREYEIYGPKKVKED